LALSAIARNPVGPKSGYHSGNSNGNRDNKGDDFPDGGPELSLGPVSGGSGPLDSFYRRIGHTPLFAQFGVIATFWALAIGLISGAAAAFGWWGWRDRRGRYGPFLGGGPGLSLDGLNVLFIANLP
jgi:hypothetical protein